MSVPGCAGAVCVCLGFASRVRRVPLKFGVLRGLIDLIVWGGFFCADWPGPHGRLELRALPTGVKWIGELAFEHSGRLGLETLPAGLEFVGEGAFLGCGIRRRWALG
jgi:hypothetical protein